MNNDIKIVQKLELELLDYNTRKSAKKLGDLIANDFFEFTQSGTQTNKTDIINILPNLPEENFSVENMQGKTLGENYVLLNYIADRKVVQTGEEKTTLCSSIWEKQGDNKWQMIFFQGTPKSKN